MNSDLVFLADTAILESLTDKHLMIITAGDESVIESIAGSVKDYVTSLFDPKRPVASVVSFLGKGLLFSTGFRWISVFYTLAEVLGFDWISFWSGLGNSIKELVEEIIQYKSKPSEKNLAAKINPIVSQEVDSNFTGTVDKKRLLELSKRAELSFTNIGRTKFAADLNDAIELKELALRIESSKSFVKESAWSARLLKGKLGSFFKRIIPWLIRVALTSIGLTTGGGAAAALLGGKKPLANDEENYQQVNLQISQNVPKEFFTPHRNDLSNVWVERGSIDDMENLLLNWVLSSYPQLSDKTDAIRNSSSFQSMLSKFRTRNRLASGLGIFSVPKPYQRKIDIVSAIVNGFLKDSDA